MCVVERRTYQHPDGRRETVERIRPCHRAAGSKICDEVDVRDIEEANLIERRPNAERASRSALLFTEGFNGRRNVYREVDQQSGRRESVRRSSTLNTPSPLASSPSRSSATHVSYVERRPKAPSPPAAASSPAAAESSATAPGNRPVRTIRADGTASYDRPPSLDFPRAQDNERRTRFVEPDLVRRSPVSSVKAEADDVVEP
ncbi:hypothetical protein LTR53_002702, partial [Teratosphaeriaceae sp. CCFEE 6253]